MKDRVICFMGGGVKFITSEQESFLFSQEVTRKGSATVEGDILNLSSIARIIDTEEYYREKPNMRPAPEPIKDFPHLTMGEIRRGNVRRAGLESLIRGIENYIASPRYQGTNKPKELLVTFKRRLETFDNN